MGTNIAVKLEELGVYAVRPVAKLSKATSFEHLQHTFGRDHDTGRGPVEVTEQRSI